MFKPVSTKPDFVAQEHARGMRLCREAAAIAFAKCIGNVGAGTVGDELQFLQCFMPGEQIAKLCTESFRRCNCTQAIVRPRGPVQEAHRDIASACFRVVCPDSRDDFRK